MVNFVVDFEGGPKLRKWYGAPDLLPKDGSNEEDEEKEDEEKEDEFPGNLKWKLVDFIFIYVYYLDDVLKQLPGFDFLFKKIKTQKKLGMRFW